MPETISAVDVIVTSPGRNYVIVKITTSAGLVGWGDATVNGRELAVASYVRDHIGPTLVGQDPGNIEDIWQYLYRGAYWRRGPVTMAAIGGVDLALWDLLGKSLDVPVYRLLGGAVRSQVLAYTHASGWSQEELEDAVDAKRAEGFRAVRAQFGVPGLDVVYGISREAGYEPAARGSRPMAETWDAGAYLRHAPRTLLRLREHVGPELHLLHDAHHRLNPTQAARLAKELETVDLFWLEDLIPAENPDLLRRVREHSTTPLAIGEVFNTIWDCRTIISERLADYIRTAVGHAGGISHLRKILHYAEVHQVDGGPHGPSDVSPLCMSASIHVGLSTHNFGIQELMGYPTVTSEVFQPSYTFTDGYLHPGEEPGLGVEVDETAASAFPYAPAYLPIARTRDGAITDW